MTAVVGGPRARNLDFRVRDSDEDSDDGETTPSSAKPTSPPLPSSSTLQPTAPRAVVEPSSSSSTSNVRPPKGSEDKNHAPSAVAIVRSGNGETLSASKNETNAQSTSQFIAQHPQNCVVGNRSDGGPPEKRIDPTSMPASTAERPRNGDGKRVIIVRRPVPQPAQAFVVSSPTQPTLTTSGVSNVLVAASLPSQPSPRALETCANDGTGTSHPTSEERSQQHSSASLTQAKVETENVPRGMAADGPPNTAALSPPPRRDDTVPSATVATESTRSLAAAEEIDTEGSTSPVQKPHSPFIFRPPPLPDGEATESPLPQRLFRSEDLWPSETQPVAVSESAKVAADVGPSSSGATPSVSNGRRPISARGAARTPPNASTPRSGRYALAIRHGAEVKDDPFPPTPTPRAQRPLHAHCRLTGSIVERAKIIETDRKYDDQWSREMRERQDIWRQIDELTFQPNLDRVRRETLTLLAKDRGEGPNLVAKQMQMFQTTNSKSITEKLYLSQKEVTAAKKALEERRNKARQSAPPRFR